MSAVYFVQSGTDGPIKIGTAVDVPARIALLQIGNAEPLCLLGAVEGGQREERGYHILLATHRIRGEWFRPHSDVLAMVGKPLPERSLIRTHADIIADASVARIADLTNVSIHTVAAWRKRDSIPGWHWLAFRDAGFATLEELAVAASASGPSA